MRGLVLFVVVIVMSLGLWLGTRTSAWSKTSAMNSALAADESKAAETKPSAKVDFPTQIKPMLQGKCQPCHFDGGKMYSKMPFDRPETIRTLGSKLFTRIKDENERRLIREFLAQE